MILQIVKSVKWWIDFFEGHPDFSKKLFSTLIRMQFRSRALYTLALTIVRDMVCSYLWFRGHFSWRRVGSKFSSISLLCFLFIPRCIIEEVHHQIFISSTLQEKLCRSLQLFCLIFFQYCELFWCLVYNFLSSFIIDFKQIFEMFFPLLKSFFVAYCF